MKISVIIITLLFCGCMGFQSDLYAQYESQVPLNVRIAQFDPSHFPQFNVYVAVENKNGEPLKGLRIENFKLTEDLIPYPLTEVIPALDLKDDDVSNLTVALVIDNSYSMKDVLDLVSSAANQFIDNLRPNDKTGIFVFRERRKLKGIHAKMLENFTNVKYVLKSNTEMNIASLTQKTYLFDAVYLACEALEKQETLGRKAIIVLSDGKDIGSKVRLNSLINLARATDIPIYTINFLKQGDEGALTSMAGKTGGEYFFAKKAEDLNDVYNNILAQLQGLYRLSYNSDENNWNKSSRTIQVEVTWESQIYAANRSFDADAARMEYLNLLFKEKKVAAKEQDYIDFINNYPGSEWQDDIKFKLGVFYEERGSYNKALEIFDELSMMPQSEWQDDVLFHKGKIYEQQGDFEKAVDFYTQMVTNHPQENATPSSYLGIARSHRELGHTQEALEAYNKIRDNFPGSDVTDDALLELSYLMNESGQTESAKQVLTELVQKYPNSDCAVHGYYELATMEQQAGNLDAALQYCHASLDATENSSLLAKAMCKQGEIYFEMQNWSSAINSYNNIIENHAGNGYDDAAYYGLSKSYQANQDYMNMRNNFEALEDLARQGQQVRYDFHDINQVQAVIPPQNGGWTASLSGAKLEVPAGAVSFPLQVNIKSIPTPETAQNLAIAGKVYDYTATVDTFFNPIDIALPYDEAWFEDEDKDRRGFQIYSYENNEWKQIENSEIDTVNRVIHAAVTHLSLKTIMYKKPIVIKFTDVLFEFGKADLTAGALTQLDQVVEILNESEKLKLEIAGHTDSVGTDQANMNLSKRRSESIKRNLVTRGIEAGRIIAKGYGEKFPIAGNNTDEGRQQNRRTEFVVISKGENDILDEAQKQRYARKFAIQLGLFATSNQAFAKAEFFRKRGYKVELIEKNDNGKVVHQLLCGSFDSRQAAQEYAQAIQDEYKQVQFAIIER